MREVHHLHAAFVWEENKLFHLLRGGQNTAKRTSHTFWVIPLLWLGKFQKKFLASVFFFFFFFFFAVFDPQISAWFGNFQVFCVTKISGKRVSDKSAGNNRIVRKVVMVQKSAACRATTLRVDSAWLHFHSQTQKMKNSNFPFVLTCSTRKQKGGFFCVYSRSMSWSWNTMVPLETGQSTWEPLLEAGIVRLFLTCLDSSWI